MAKTLKKVMAVLLAGLVTATAPVNVSAAAASEDGHVVFGGYGQRSSCEVQFDKSITSIVGYGRQADIDVSGTIRSSHREAATRRSILRWMACRWRCATLRQQGAQYCSRLF